MGALLGLSLLAAPGAARADEAPPDPHAVQPERPSVATHAHTVAPGWVEIECGLERDQLADGSLNLGAPLETKVGLPRRFQLSLFTPWQRVGTGPRAQAGVGDFAAGVKWRLTDGCALLGDFAVLPVLKLPTGSASRGTGSGTTDASLVLISSRDLGPVSLDVNVGGTRRSGDGHIAPRAATLWTVSAGYPLWDWLQGATEIYGLPGTSGPAGQRPIVALLAGPSATPRPWLELDAGLIVPIVGPQPHAVFAGFVWNLGRL